MGRKTDYAQMHNKENKKTYTFDQVKEKFGREVMSTAEFAAYLSGISGVPIDEKTVKNRIKAICEDSNGTLTNNDFREDASNNRSKYELKPRYHAILLTLINTEYFDGRKNDRRVSTRGKLYEQLASNIERYLPKEEKEVVTSNPSYINARLEGLLSRHMSNELSALIRDIYHMDSTLRYQVMIHFIEQLMTLRKWVESIDSKAMAVRLVYTHTMDDRRDAIYQKGMFESTTLDRFLIHYLALRVHDEDYTYASDNEKMSMPALFLISQMFHLNIDKDASVAELFKKVDAQIEDQPRYKEITEKAKEIFDLSNPVECEIFEILKRLVKIQYLRPDVTPEEYNRMIRFQESAISKDKWDLWNMLLQIGRKNMSKEDIDAMMEIINKNKERKNS